MFSQDWEPVVFKKKKPEEQRKGPSGAPPKLIREDTDTFHVKTVSKETAHKISSMRIALKLTQDQLAQKVNLRPAVIKDIEACKGPKDSAAINKILNFLTTQSH